MSQIRFIGKCDDKDSWIEDTQEQLVLGMEEVVNLLNYLTTNGRFVCKYTGYGEGYVKDTHEQLLLGVFETVDLLNDFVEVNNGELL